MRKLVLQHPDGHMEILGAWDRDTQPPDVLAYRRHSQEEPIDLVSVHPTYWLYRFPVRPTGRLGEDHFQPNQR